MKVKNIKSFVDFYKSLEISTCITSIPRSKIIKEKNRHLANKNQLQITQPLSTNIKEELNKLKDEINSCNCDLKDIATNLVFSDGQEKSNIMVIGEAPGADEDKLGKPFVGQAGKLLNKMFNLIGLDRQINFYITNVIFWRPPGNRTPSKLEIEACLPFTKKHIRIIKPKLLILLGNVAAQSILCKNEGINILREENNFFEDDFSELKIPAKAIFHPAYLLRNPLAKKKMWDDLLNINQYICQKNLI